MEHPLRFQSGLKYAHKCPAAADIPIEPFLDLLGCGVGMLLEYSRRCHDESRRTEAAHQAVGIAKGLLNRMQLIAIR
jgi:hypothetical protein